MKNVRTLAWIALFLAANSPLTASAEKKNIYFDGNPLAFVKVIAVPGGQASNMYFCGAAEFGCSYECKPIGRLTQAGAKSILSCAEKNATAGNWKIALGTLGIVGGTFTAVGGLLSLNPWVIAGGVAAAGSGLKYAPEGSAQANRANAHATCAQGAIDPKIHSQVWMKASEFTKHMTDAVNFCSKDLGIKIQLNTTPLRPFSYSPTPEELKSLMATVSSQ